MCVCLTTSHHHRLQDWVTSSQRVSQRSTSLHQRAALASAAMFSTPHTHVGLVWVQLPSTSTCVCVTPCSLYRLGHILPLCAPPEARVTC